MGFNCSGHVQGLTHRLDIFNHLTHFGDTVCLKKVIAPSLSRSHIVKGCWIGGDPMRRECVGGSYVFIKGNASTECTDTREPGRNEVVAKIAEAITHLVIRLLAFGVKGKGCRCLDLNKQHGVLVKLDGKQRYDVNRIAGCLRDVVLRGDFEWALEAEKMVEESSVWAVIDGFIGGDLRLVC